MLPEAGACILRALRVANRAKTAGAVRVGLALPADGQEAGHRNYATYLIWVSAEKKPRCQPSKKDSALFCGVVPDRSWSRAGNRAGRWRASATCQE